MKIKPEEITNIIRQQIEGFEKKLDINETGTVLTVGDGVARVYGLTQVMVGELVEFESGIKGMALNLEEGSVGIVVMGDDTGITEGSSVKRTKTIASVPVGEELLGRVLTPRKYILNFSPEGFFHNQRCQLLGIGLK